MSFLVKSALRPNLSNKNKILFKNSANILPLVQNVRSKGDQDLFVKTTINALTEDERIDLQITGYNKNGFAINNKINVMGPIVIFPKLIYCWNIADESDINPKSLNIFPLLEPKLDVLLIGCGQKQPKFNSELHKWFIQNKVRNFEILTTEKAINAFNFLVAEGRLVGAALVPADPVRGPDEDSQRLMERERLYFPDDKQKPAQKVIQNEAPKNEPKPIEPGSEKKTQ